MMTSIANARANPPPILVPTDHLIFYPPTSVHTAVTPSRIPIPVSSESLFARFMSPPLHVRQSSCQKESCLCRGLLFAGLSPPSDTLSRCLSRSEAAAESPEVE